MAHQLLRLGNGALLQGNFDEAVLCFSRSMVLFSQEVSDDDTVRGVAASDSPRPMIQSIDLGVNERHASAEALSSHNVVELFDRAFLPLHFSSPATPVVVCIYNIGLSHHVKAVRQAENSSLHFKKARQLYKLAWHQLDKLGPQEDCLLLVKLALLNNLEHVACHFFDKTEVEASSQAIFNLLADDKCQHIELPHPDAFFFYSMRCFHGIQWLNQAAAA